MISRIQLLLLVACLLQECCAQTTAGPMIDLGSTTGTMTTYFTSTSPGTMEQTASVAIHDITLPSSESQPVISDTTVDIFASGDESVTTEETGNTTQAAVETTTGSTTPTEAIEGSGATTSQVEFTSTVPDTTGVELTTFEGSGTTTSQDEFTTTMPETTGGGFTTAEGSGATESQDESTTSPETTGVPSTTFFPITTDSSTNQVVSSMTTRQTTNAETTTSFTTTTDAITSQPESTTAITEASGDESTTFNPTTSDSFSETTSDAATEGEAFTTTSFTPTPEANTTTFTTVATEIGTGSGEDPTFGTTNSETTTTSFTTTSIDDGTSTTIFTPFTSFEPTTDVNTTTATLGPSTEAITDTSTNVPTLITDITDVTSATEFTATLDTTGTTQTTPIVTILPATGVGDTTATTPTVTSDSTTAMSNSAPSTTQTTPDTSSPPTTQSTTPQPGTGTSSTATTEPTTTISTGSGGSDNTTATTAGSTIPTAASTTPVVSGIFSTVTDTLTSGASTVAEETTATAATAEAFPWYLIVIICMGIVILILLIVFIVVCCLYQKAAKKPSDTATNGTIINKHATEKTAPNAAIKMQALPVVSQPRPTVAPPPPPKKQETTSFISETPMQAPRSMPDPSATVRKREVRPRVVTRTPSVDEGFNEPLLKKRERSKAAKKKQAVELKSIRRKPPRDSDESQTSTSDRYNFPPPVKMAMVSNALGNAIKEDEEAHAHALQRSEIERYRNKQRMRKQRARFANEAYRDAQIDIDRVLVPAPPGVFQAQPRKRHHKKRGQMALDGRPKENADVRLMMQDGGGTYKDRMSDTEDTATSSDRGRSKRVEQEATIARMTKLLEQVYAVLSPSVQRNATVSPVVPEQQHVPVQVQPHGLASESHPATEGQGGAFFTRTQPPPAFQPQNGSAFTQVPNGRSPGANDAASVVWTPYRAFDQVQKLSSEDPSFAMSAPDPGQGSYIIPGHNQLPEPHSRTISDDPQYYASSNFAPPPGAIGTNMGVHAPAPMMPGPGQGLQHAMPTPSADLEEGNPYRSGGNESPSSIVQSIKDTLSRLTGSPTPVHELTSVEPR